MFMPSRTSGRPSDVPFEFLQHAAPTVNILGAVGAGEVEAGVGQAKVRASESPDDDAVFGITSRQLLRCALRHQSV
jgi:hypothetical protein